MNFQRKLPADVVQEHLDIFLKAPNSIYLGHIASAGVLLYIAAQNPAVSSWFLWGWGIAQVIGYPLLMEIWSRRCKKADRGAKDNYRWIDYMDWLCVFVGATWGLMFFVSLNEANSAHFAIQLSIAAGASSAAVRSLATFPRSFIVYSIPMLGLLVLRLLLMGGEYILLGGLVGIFLLMLLVSGEGVMEAVTRYIAIKNENLDLAERYRKAADDADHANREKTRLLAAASHDLRQPIHAIGLYMETLSIAKMDEHSRQTLERIRNSLQTLTKLFNSLLDVSLLDAGKVKVRTSHFNIKPMLNSVLDDYEPLAEIAHATLVLECEDKGVEADPVLLRRMVQNLVSNAIRYSNGGTVRLTSHVQQDGSLSIVVSDQGPGIPKEHQAVIFEEFSQLAKHKDPLANHEQGEMGQDKGLGLGLAIVRRLADLQNLTISVQSSDQGTDLAISGLPQVDVPQQETNKQSPMARIDALFARKHLLVADDDAATLEATANLLRAWGCKVSLASGLDDIKPMAKQPDLLISDFSFEGHCTGLDIITKARKIFGPSLPAMIVSGDSSPQVQKQVEEANLLLVYKPVQPVQLRSALLEVFMSSKSEQSGEAGDKVRVKQTA